MRILTAIIFAFVVVNVAFAFKDVNSPFEINKRTAPVGEVSVAKETPKQVGDADNPVAEKKVALTLPAITDLYNKACMACHAAGIANAPKFGDKNAWAAKFKATGKTKYTEQIAILIDTIKKGKGAMPAKGNCPDCTNEQYEALINYMASNGKSIEQDK